MSQIDIVFHTEQAVFNYRVAGIWIENGHVLLHRDVKELNWSLPGGRVTIGEESQHSLKREFQEELAIDIHVNRMAFVIENFFKYNGRNFHEIGFYYVITSDKHFASYSKKTFYGIEGERLIFQWMPLDELDKTELYPQCLRSTLQKLPPSVKHFVEQ